MANERMRGVKSLFQNKQTRVVVILTFGALIAAVVWSNMAAKNQQTRPKDLQAAVGTPSMPSVVAVPGTSDNPLHNAKVREENLERVRQAEKTGESVVPRLTQAAEKEADPFDLMVKKPAPDNRLTEPPIPTPATPTRVAAGQSSQQVPLTAQPVAKTQSQIKAEADMAAAMRGLLDSWTPARQVVEVEYKNTAAPAGQMQQASLAQNSAQQAGYGAASAGQAAGAASTAPEEKPVALKAGSILHGVVLTAVNSDEPGPVLAQIITGPYAGGRMLGKFELAKDSGKVILSFNVLTMQNAARSYAITSFAVDPQTARTGFASDVDRHYLSRYGLFAAAEFAKGYGNALSQSGSTQTVNAGVGGVSSTTTYPALNNKQIALSALGSLGGEVGNSLRDGLRRPPTVTLNAGTEIGVLIMQDASF